MDGDKRKQLESILENMKKENEQSQVQQSPPRTPPPQQAGPPPPSHHGGGVPPPERGGGGQWDNNGHAAGALAQGAQIAAPGMVGGHGPGFVIEKLY